MAHNLSREIQMPAALSAPRASSKRPAAWFFERLDTLRHRIIQRAGRVTRCCRDAEVQKGPSQERREANRPDFFRGKRQGGGKAERGGKIQTRGGLFLIYIIILKF
jgi:hypothetical protein